MIAPTRMAPIGAYNPVYRRQPSLPMQPQFPQPVYQQPVYRPAPPVYQQPSYGGYPSYGQTNGVQAFFHGIVDRAQELAQYVMHPFDASRRMMPFHNPYQPRSTAEEAGRWAVNGALIVGAFLLGRGLMGGGTLLPGVARVGSSSSVAFSFGSMLRGIGSVITAPIRFIGSLFGRGGASVF